MQSDPQPRIHPDIFPRLSNLNIRFFQMRLASVNNLNASTKGKSIVTGNFCILSRRNFGCYP